MPQNGRTGRAIVTVGVGNRPDLGKSGESHIIGTSFSAMLDRWYGTFSLWDIDAALFIHREWPMYGPPHEENPYAFKVYAINEAKDKGLTKILWADASVVAIRSLEPIWSKVEKTGYWIPDNTPWNCGQWTSDEALTLLRVTRAEAFQMPHLAATAFALDLDTDIGKKLLMMYWSGCGAGAFKGPWTNENHQASHDDRVLGHRHDQSVLSIAAWQLGLTPTPQPTFFSDYRGENDETILTVKREL